MCDGRGDGKPQEMTDKELAERYRKLCSVKASQIIRLTMRNIDLEIENSKLKLYKVFYDHIKAHLPEDCKVMCKICNRTFEQIILDEWRKKQDEDKQETKQDNNKVG